MTTVQRWTGVETTALRLAMRQTVRGFAEHLGVEPRTVAKWEQRGDTITLLPESQALLDTALRRTSEEARERFEASVQQSNNAEDSQNTRSESPWSSIDLAEVRPLSSVAAVLGPSETLTVLEEFTQSVVIRYELEGPHRLAPEVRALRHLCQQLGSQVSGADERMRLTAVSGRQSALLAYMFVNLSRYDDAEHYALEASMLATAVKDWPLLAWIKGTQSFTTYYQERYDDALNLARVGVQLAGSDGQRIRLLSNGVARAAGKLGDRHAVDQAVDEAFALVEKQDSPTGMTPCIDFAPYGWARTAANAATAYLSVGDYAQALQLTQELSTTVAASNSDWSRSLVQLDEASALTLGRQADLEHAASVGMEALAASASKPIASVGTRAAELAISLQRHGSHRAGQDFATALHEWKRRVPEVTA